MRRTFAVAHLFGVVPPVPSVLAPKGTGPGLVEADGLVRDERVDHHLLVVSAHASCEAPGFEPHEGVGASGAAVDEVADGEEPVAGRLEFERLEGVLEGVDLPVEVPDDQIAPPDGIRSVSDGGRVRVWREVALHAYASCRRSARGNGSSPARSMAC